MVRYIMFLLAAILGRNPFKKELDDMTEKLEKASENVQRLREMYYSVLENWQAAMTLLEQQRTEDERQRNDLQNLVENLRERIKEKNAELERHDEDFRSYISRIKQDYQQRIDAYSEELLRYGNKKLTENP